MQLNTYLIILADMSSVVNLSISIGSRDFPVDAWRVMALKRYFLIASSNCSVFWTHFSVSESLSRRRWSILHVPSIGVHGILPPLWTTRMTYASEAWSYSLREVQSMRGIFEGISMAKIWRPNYSIHIGILRLSTTEINNYRPRSFNNKILER